MVFLVIAMLFEVVCSKMPPSVPIALMVIPFSKGVSGTTNQKSVAESAVEPNVTPVPQLRVISLVAFEPITTSGSPP